MPEITMQGQAPVDTAKTLRYDEGGHPAKQIEILQKGADSSLHTFMLQKWKKQAKIHGETAQLKWKKPPVVMALVDDKI